MQKSITKFSLLSVSLLVVSAGAIAGNIPAIAQTFPDIHPIYVELVTTISSLFIIVTVMLSTKVARKIGYKRTVQLGVTLVFLASLVPVVVHNFWLLFVSRMFFGVGVGLFNPLLYSFSSYLYSGKELATVIGLQSSFEGIGGMVLTFTVGQLLKINWEVSFLVYCIALPILLLFTKFVPQVQKDNGVDLRKEKNDDRKAKSNYSIFGSILLLILIVTIYMSVTVKITSLFIENGIGNATDGSNMIAIVGLGAMLAGIIFGNLVTVAKEWTLPISFIGMGLAMNLLAFTNSLLVAAFASLLCGFSFRIFIPYLFNQVNQSNKENAEKNTSILLIGFNIGSAFAPISISLIQRLFSINNESGIFLAEGIIMLILVCITIARNFFKTII